jgi:hypothetical protein
MQKQRHDKLQHVTTHQSVQIGSAVTHLYCCCTRQAGCLCTALQGPATQHAMQEPAATADTI